MQKLHRASRIALWRRNAQDIFSMPPEFVANITVGVAQLAGLLILSLFLSRTLREISISTRVHVLQGHRVEEVMGDLRQLAP